MDDGGAGAGEFEFEPVAGTREGERGIDAAGAEVEARGGDEFRATRSSGVSSSLRKNWALALPGAGTMKGKWPKAARAAAA